MNKLSWLVPNRVLYWKLDNGATTYEFREGLIQINKILASAQAKVHILIDARTAQSLAGSTANASKIASQVAQTAQMGCCFVISHNFFFRHQLNRVTVPFGTHLRYADSFRIAWQSLRGIDTSLPYVAPNLPTMTTSRKRRFA